MGIVTTNNQQGHGHGHQKWLNRPVAAKGNG